MLRILPLSCLQRQLGHISYCASYSTGQHPALSAFPTRRASALLKNSTLRAAEPLVARCPFGCRPMLRGPWVLGPGYSAAAGQREGRKARGSGTAMVPRSPNGPQRSGPSSGTMLGFTPLFVSPAKAGALDPRWCRCPSTAPSALGIPPSPCSTLFRSQHPPCRRALGGPMSFWLPSNAPWSLGPGPRLFCRGGKTRGWEGEGPGNADVAAAPNGTPERKGGGQGKARGPAACVATAQEGAQEPGWCRCHSTDLSAVGFPPARCLSSLENQHPPCRRALGGPMSFWLPSNAPWSLGPGPRLFCRGGKTRGRKARGSGTAMVPRSPNGPQRSGPSSGTMLGFTPRSFPPRKRGPRNHGGAAATARTPAQWAFRRHGA